MSRTIANLSTWPVYGVPNFIDILEKYNQTNNQKIDLFNLNIKVESTSKIEALSYDVNTFDGLPEAPLSSLCSELFQKIKSNLPKYFEKFPETINSVQPGSYTCTYKIEVPYGLANKKT